MFDQLTFYPRENPVLDSGPYLFITSLTQASDRFQQLTILVLIRADSASIVNYCCFGPEPCVRLAGAVFDMPPLWTAPSKGKIYHV